MNLFLPVTRYRFSERDLIGGDAAIDFVNTVAGRDQTPRDHLEDYAHLLEWAELTQVLPAKLLRKLARKAQSEPVASSKALSDAKVLRESLFALMARIASGRAPRKADLVLLQRFWIAGCSAHELGFSDGHVVAEVRDVDPELDLIASIVAYRLVENVLPLPADRLRICQGPDCAWLFIDSSKAGRRRWCDMAVCGNAAKSRRFHARAALSR